MGGQPVILVHGGAWSIPDRAAPDHLRGVRNAMVAGWNVLERSGSALDAVEEAVVVMEDDENFDAGRGSFLNREGVVQLDALIMEGSGLRAGGVGCVERIRNPVRAARKVLCDSPHAYLVGEGAERFAAEHGVPLCDQQDLVVEREVERLRDFLEQADQRTTDWFSPPTSHDTVGAVALDHGGNLAAATSTGGTLGKSPGRIGDSSLVGCGCYADNESGAASTTGWGEPIMRLVLAKRACDRIASGDLPEQVATAAISYLEQRLGGHGGVILLDAKCRFGIAHNTSRMAWAVRTEHQERVGIQYPESR
jgi:L-asparaginase / beta-aspartyl-peptidase